MMYKVQTYEYDLRSFLVHKFLNHTFITLCKKMSKLNKCKFFTNLHPSPVSWWFQNKRNKHPATMN